MSVTFKMSTHCSKSAVGGLMMQADTINPPCTPPGPTFPQQQDRNLTEEILSFQSIKRLSVLGYQCQLTAFENSFHGNAV